MSLFLFIFLSIYSWIIYPLLLKVLSLFYTAIRANQLARPLKISVIIAAYNEEKRIGSRIKNILASEFDMTLLEIIVVSDGSTDDTLQIARSFTEHKVTTIELATKSGRANAHNAAVGQATGDILVFTDAETVFDPLCLQKLVEPFQKDPQLGLTSATLFFNNSQYTNLTRSANLYWKYELWLRQQETRLGLYSFSSGACMAMRKKLYKTIPDTGDVDFTSPLDVILQGFRCAHIMDAIAYDQMPATQTAEFRSRVRMTSKNFYGILTRWNLANIFKHPIYSWVILSHKIFRWLTPVFLILLFLMTLMSLLDGSTTKFEIIIFYGQVLFYLSGLAGFILHKLNLSLPVFSQIYNFFLANLGFLLGLYGVIRNKIPSSYTPVSQQ